MGRRVDVDELVGASEIAMRAGVKRSVVHDWRDRYRPDGEYEHLPHFPDPVAQLSATKKTPALVWYWPDVEAWLRRTNRVGDDAPR